MQGTFFSEPTVIRREPRYLKTLEAPLQHTLELTKLNSHPEFRQQQAVSYTYGSIRSRDSREDQGGTQPRAEDTQTQPQYRLVWCESIS